MKKHLREIRSLYKNFSYTASREDLPKLKSSLNHSLRLKEDSKRIEWNAELSHLNLVMIDGDFVSMKSISRETREAMLESLLPSAKPKGNGGLTKLQQTRRNYALKVRTSIKSEVKAGNEKAAQFLQQLLDISHTNEISKQHYLSKGEDIFLSRSKQRLNMISNYIDAHNALISQPHKRSARYITESIFKIPHNWNIGDDKVSGQELANLLMSFYRKYFPEHDIKLAVIHRDERTTQFKEQTGDHVHVFIDAASNITSQSDLRLSMFRAAERSLKLVYTDYVCIADTKTSFSNEEIRWFGHGLQILFTAYSNVHLFKPKGLISRFNEKTDEQLELNERIKIDSRKPKNQREYQYAAREAAITSKIEESKLKELKKKTRETESRLALTDNRLQDMNSEFNRTNESLAATNHELSQKHAELNEKTTKIQLLKSALNEQGKIAIARDAFIKKQAAMKEHLDNQIHQRQRHIANLDKSIDDRSRNNRELGKLIEKQQMLIDSKKVRISVIAIARFGLFRSPDPAVFLSSYFYAK